MAGDEPRRSGRATKGQNKTLEGSPEAVSKPKKAAKAKPSKKAAQPVEEENEEDAEETIRCVCGDNTDDEAGRKFIACDACEAWQHNVCMGVSLEEDEQPEHYFCEQCRPEEHKELLEAMARGEKPWEERQKAAKSRKKGPKRGRKSGKAGSEAKTEAPDSASEPPAVPEESGNKRKFEEEPQSTVQHTNGHAQPPTETPPVSRADKKRKSGVKESAAKDPTTALVDISALPKERQNVAIALTKLVSDGVRDREKSGSFKPQEGDTVESLSKRFAQLIEYELFINHGVAGKGLQNYGAQFRAINANFKKNPALLDRLLRKSLSPAELAVMSSQDMASEELQREREKMKEEADKQAVMIREDEKPRVRRTHKGDEYVDEAAGSNGESVFTSQPVRRRDSEMAVDGAGSPTVPTSAGSPLALNTQRGSVGAGRRQSSQNFDINSVWDKTAASPDSERPSSHIPIKAEQVPAQDRPTGDADIDRLLADDDADDTYSPQDSKPSASSIVWQGKLLQPGVTSLVVSARFAAGNDFSRYASWDSFLPSMLEIEGRLERSKADEYMCGLQWSRKSDVSVLMLSAYDDRAAFDTIFEYFHSRKRYAVGKKGHGCSELIKDLYISPIDKGEKPPPHIDLLDHSAIPSPSQEKILLLTVVVNKPASWDQADSAMPIPAAAVGQPPRMSLPGPAGSPITASGPQFSPAPRPGSTQDASHSALPPNPYTPGGAFPSNVYRGQPQYLPHHQQQQHQRPGSEVPGLPQFSHGVAAILGPYAGCQVAQQILAATGGIVQEQEARNMVDVFERDPRARDDMTIFGSILQRP